MCFRFVLMGLFSWSDWQDDKSTESDFSGSVFFNESTLAAKRKLTIEKLHFIMCPTKRGIEIGIQY